jgi:transcriptional regulator with XRE-family HTH domain
LQTLKILRSERRLSISDLAKRSGVSRAAVWQLEQGENSPTLRTVEKLAQALGCGVADLVGESVPRPYPDTAVSELVRAVEVGEKSA